MKSVHLVFLTVMFLLTSLFLCPLFCEAAPDCSFRKTLQKGGYSFQVASRPADGCSVQILDVTAMRGGKPFARFKTDADMQVVSAWVADLDDDGKPELVLASKSHKSGNHGALDVIYLDGSVLKKVSQPDLKEYGGYQGDDSFRIEGKVVVRSFPVYSEKNGGGTRVVRYTFRDKKLIEGEAVELPAITKSEPEKRVSAPTAVQTPVNRKSVYRVSGNVVIVDRTLPDEQPQVIRKTSKPTLEAITQQDGAIDIQVSGGRPGKFKTLKLDKPERIAIDIYAATVALQSKSIQMGKNGISRARIGINTGFVRIVLDSELPAFPAYKVSATDSGVRVEFP